MRKLAILIILLASSVLVMPTSALAADIYYSQSGAGGATGANCANAKAITAFNAVSADWTAGNNLHLCGTITTALTAQGDGSAGFPISILFESSSSLSIPACGTVVGCLDLAAHNFISIDSVDLTHQGVIQATNNGTGNGVMLTGAPTTAGTGYVVSGGTVCFGGTNLLTVTGGTQTATVRVTSIDVNGGITGIQVCRGGLGFTVNQVLSGAQITGNTGTGAQLTVNTVTTGGFASSTNGLGITLSGHDITFKHFTIGPIYQHLAGSYVIVNGISQTLDSQGGSSYAINATTALSNITLDTMEWTQSRWGVRLNATNLLITNANCHDTDHCLEPTGFGNVTNQVIHDFHFHDFATWNTVANDFHHDGIHYFGSGSQPVTTGVYIYNGRVDTNTNGMTGPIFTESSCTINNAYVFNNIFIPSQTVNGHIDWTSKGDNINFFNNTMMGNSTDPSGVTQGGCLIINNSTNFTIKNQVINNCAVQFQDMTVAGTVTNGGVDSNFYSAKRNPNVAWVWQGSFKTTLAAWRTANGGACPSGVTIGLDCNGQDNANGLLNSDGTLQSTSPARVANGAVTADLSALCTGVLVPLCSDINGVSRLSGGIWAGDAGAAQFVTVASSYTVTVAANGVWTGTIVGSGGSPASTINCIVTAGGTSGTCSETQNAGATPTYTPTVTIGNLTSWSGGGCAGTSTCVPIVNSPLTLTMTGNAAISCGLTFASNSINVPSLATPTTIFTGLSGPGSFWFIFGPPPNNTLIFNCPYPFLGCNANGQTGNIISIGSGQYTAGACSNSVCCTGSSAPLNVNNIGIGGFGH